MQKDNFLSMATGLLAKQGHLNLLVKIALYTAIK